MPSIAHEGSITFWLQHEHKDWFENEDRYSFGSFKQEEFEVQATKQPDKTIELNVIGTLNQQFNFRESIPHCDDKGLFVAITWAHSSINLYLNGNLTRTLKSDGS